MYNDQFMVVGGIHGEQWRGHGRVSRAGEQTGLSSAGGRAAYVDNSIGEARRSTAWFGTSHSNTKEVSSAIQPASDGPWARKGWSSEIRWDSSPQPGTAA